MGISFTASGSFGALRTPVPLANRSERICVDAFCSDLFGAVGSTAGDGQFARSKTSQRQLALLARLVRQVEPHGAEQTAARILSQFGTLARLLAQPLSALQHRIGNENLANTIYSARMLVVESLREEASVDQFDSADPRVISYLVASIGRLDQECLRIIYLDVHRRFILDEELTSGDWSGLQLNLRMLMRRAIEHNAAKLVLYHNHPSGCVEPSGLDISFTKTAQKFTGAIGIEIYDHFIVAGPRVFSMKVAGLI